MVGLGWVEWCGVEGRRREGKGVVVVYGLGCGFGEGLAGEAMEAFIWGRGTG